MTAAISVLLVDDHTMVRRGLDVFFRMLDDIDVVGEASDGREALNWLAIRANQATLPDVVLMDLVMPGLDGVAAIAEIKRRYPAIEVLALTGFSEAGRVHTALDAGATGYLLKNADAEEIASAVRAAKRGEVHLDQAVAGHLTGVLRAPGYVGAALTARERAILILVAQGKSNLDMAIELVIGERTVRTHVSNILTKLDLASRTQAALWAIREGLVAHTWET